MNFTYFGFSGHRDSKACSAYHVDFYSDSVILALSKMRPLTPGSYP